MFYGESMFSRATDASKVALVALVEDLRARGLPMIDCQQRTPLLASLGAREIPRRTFLRRIAALVNYARASRKWSLPVSRLNDLPHAVLQFYVTAPYPCSYLPERMARSQVATPSHLINTELYGELVKAGFRRSGIFTYRPHCDGCRACVPVRVPVAEFKPNRAQRRAWQQHGELAAQAQPLKFRLEHYALYLRYQSTPPLRRRHGQRQPRPVLPVPAAEPRRHAPGRVPRQTASCVMVSIVDFLPDGLSSVYTFFEPGPARRVLRHLQRAVADRPCRALGLPYLYLGYWIEREPEDGLQVKLRADRGLHRRRVAPARLQPTEGPRIDCCMRWRVPSCSRSTRNRPPTLALHVARLRRRCSLLRAAARLPRAASWAGFPQPGRPRRRAWTRTARTSTGSPRSASASSSSAP